MSIIEQLSAVAYYVVGKMKVKNLAPKQVLSVCCHTIEATHSVPHGFPSKISGPYRGLRIRIKSGYVWQRFNPVFADARIYGIPGGSR